MYVCWGFAVFPQTCSRVIVSGKFKRGSRGDCGFLSESYFSLCETQTWYHFRAKIWISPGPIWIGPGLIWDWFDQSGTDWGKPSIRSLRESPEVSSRAPDAIYDLVMALLLQIYRSAYCGLLSVTECDCLISDFWTPDSVFARIRESETHWVSKNNTAMVRSNTGLYRCRCVSSILLAPRKNHRTS